MVVDEQRQVRTDRIFHALADPTRRDIVVQAMRGEYSVSDLARRYPMSFAAVQKHVAVLAQAELVVKHRQGRRQLVRTNIDAIRDAAQVLDQLEALWRARLERFGDVLADLPPDPDHPRPHPRPTDPHTTDHTQGAST